MVSSPAFTQSSAAWLLNVKSMRGEGEAAAFTEAMQCVEQWSPELTGRAILMADALLTIKVDAETILAALLYPLIKDDGVSLEVIASQFGLGVSQLLNDTLQLQSLSRLQHVGEFSSGQQENIRKMLIGMVTDIRTVLIVLAERLALLKEAKNLDAEYQQRLANDTLSVHAPLANRVGVWELKWEMEDLCLRYLEPAMYTQISRWLVTKRRERELALKNEIDHITQRLANHGIKVIEVNGRVKHIYSIYQKVKRKGGVLDDIHDCTAIRILVQHIDDCYAVLGVMQNAYQHLDDEFEDYIAQPKPNGYRSIHMVVKTPARELIEIQIRTRAMHQEAELGAASHWRYKEGSHAPASNEHKIALLRQIMTWQKEVARESGMTTPSVDLFSDRVYVFTPQGDMIDLPVGATPIDFAYFIHSEVGHRCRGAKANGKMISLTTPLQTGQCVEIITAKSAQPSLDWLNPHYGYIKTARARSVIQHWFRVQGLLKPKETPEKAPVKPMVPPPRSRMAILTAIKNKASQVARQITGVDSLLTKVGRCCKPLPGDAVMGYITQNSGISIHRLDCRNLKQLSLKHHERLLAVNWGTNHAAMYAVDLSILASPHTNLLRDINSILAAEKIEVVGLTTHPLTTGELDIKLVVLVASIEMLKQAMKALRDHPLVREVRRLE